MSNNSAKETENKNKVIYVFFDASNIWQAIKTKGKFIDYEKTIAHIKETFGASNIKAFYYTAYPANGTRPYNLDGKHKFFTFLNKGLGFAVVKKELKRVSIVNENGESIEEKGNMDVEITIDAMHHFKKYDTAIFFTGDSDFLALITYLKNHDKKVFVFSSRNNVSEELRTGADDYIELLNIENIWGKELKRRAKLENSA